MGRRPGLRLEPLGSCVPAWAPGTLPVEGRCPVPRGAARAEEGGFRDHPGRRSHAEGKPLLLGSKGWGTCCSSHSAHAHVITPLTPTPTSRPPAPGGLLAATAPRTDRSFSSKALPESPHCVPCGHARPGGPQWPPKGTPSRDQHLCGQLVGPRGVQVTAGGPGRRQTGETPDEHPSPSRRREEWALVQRKLLRAKRCLGRSDAETAGAGRRGEAAEGRPGRARGRGGAASRSPRAARGRPPPAAPGAAQPHCRELSPGHRAARAVLRPTRETRSLPPGSGLPGCPPAWAPVSSLSLHVLILPLLLGGPWLSPSGDREPTRRRVPTTPLSCDCSAAWSSGDRVWEERRRFPGPALGSWRRACPPKLGRPGPSTVHRRGRCPSRRLSWGL